jgi:hypothetical protein
MSTRLKSSRPEISLNRIYGGNGQVKVNVCLPETHKYEWGQDTVEAISVTRAQAQALGQDLLAFANEMEEEAEYE